MPKEQMSASTAEQQPVEQETKVEVESLKEHQQRVLANLERQSLEIFEARSETYVFFKSLFKKLPKIKKLKIKGAETKFYSIDTPDEIIDKDIEDLIDLGTIDEIDDAKLVQAKPSLADLKQLDQEGLVDELIIDPYEEQIAAKSKMSDEEIENEVDSFSDTIDDLFNAYDRMVDKDGRFLDVEIDEAAKNEKDLVNQFYRYRITEIKAAMHKLAELDAQIDMLNHKRDNVRLNQGFVDAIKLKRKQFSDLQNVLKEKQELLNTNPEAFLGYAYKEITNMKSLFDQDGKIVETDFVRSRIRQVLDVIQNDKRPIFIHGELGAGKTELAKHVCRKYLSEPFLQRWEAENQAPKITLDIQEPKKPEFGKPKPKEPRRRNERSMQRYNDRLADWQQEHDQWQQSEETKKQMEQWRHNVLEYNKNMTNWRMSEAYQQQQAEYEEWQARRELVSEPLIISGHKGLEPPEIIGGRTIKSKDSELSSDQQAKLINQEIKNYKENLKKQGQSLTKEQEKELKNQWTKFFKSPTGQAELINREVDKFIEQRKKQKKDYTQDQVDQVRKAWEKHFSSPVEALPYLGKVLQAMEEGRPVIFDEINAARHHVLIILNELLTKKPGDIIIPPIPGLQPFRVKEGFCIIATGNWKPEKGSKSIYVDRNQLDAAFLSRFGLMDYDYLPQNTLNIQITDEEENISPDISKALKESDLFKMLLVRLIDEDGGAKLPQGSVFDKIYQLAKTARTIQEYLTIKGDVSIDVEGVGSVKPSKILKENVLSLRHMIPILETWKRDGFIRSLDDYIFLEYIERSNARPDEKKLLYSAFINSGFFTGNDSEGNPWPRGDEILNYDMTSKMYSEGVAVETQDMQNIKYYPPVKLARFMFGEIPKRKKVVMKALEEQVEEEVQDLEKFQEKLKLKTEWDAMLAVLAGLRQAKQEQDIPLSEEKEKILFADF